MRQISKYGVNTNTQTDVLSFSYIMVNINYNVIYYDTGYNVWCLTYVSITVTLFTVDW